VSKNTSFILGEHYGAFLSEQVSTGRYSSGSEVLRAGLRLLEEREAALDVVRAALVEGEQSGTSIEIDFDDYIAGKRAGAERRG
jgi:antitoxin ParD1/3/4